jgi:CBS domain-containing protein
MLVQNGPVPLLPVFVKDFMQPTTLTIGARESLPAAVLSMQTLGVRRLLVLQESRLVGLLTDGAVSRALPRLTAAATPWEYTFQAACQRVSEVMRPDLFTVQPGDSLDHAIGVLLEQHVGGLPVVDVRGILVGLLSVTDVLRAALAHPQACWGKVGEHMSAETITVPPDMPLAEAAARLAVTRLRVLPVVENGLLLGVLHEQDIGAALAEAVHAPTFPGDQFSLKGSCRDLMKPPGAQILKQAPFTEAIQVMLSADVHGLPVVDLGQRLLGVITVSDVLRTLLDHDPRETMSV